ncbi:MAG TPA: cellulase family glycosylhydrolase [Acetobacteraceae bacterium]|nr:cellulase family glycosylhydrolase [Acetobacteraceae bacterium]
MSAARRGTGTVLLLLLLFAVAARAEPPPKRLHVLQRGISITGWFRFPASADPAALRSYLSDQAIAGLRRAGFSFVRLPVQPGFLRAAPERLKLLIGAIRRLQRAGLAVVVDAQPATWHLETSALNRTELRGFWQTLAPALRRLDPRLTFPELLNEPVFPGAPERWQTLQDQLLHSVRRILPQQTVILTGNDWGSIAGLAALRPVADGDVVYSFHFYEPAELTSLAAYRPGLDRRALARLPFPMHQAACASLAAGTDPETSGLIRYYCALHWDATRVAERIAIAAGWGRRNHAAVLLGEFGASALLRPAARIAWLRAVREACAANGIGWALWGYDDVMGFDLPRPPGQNPALDPGVLRALGLHTSM